jgi:hypothetical protein
MGVTMRQPSTDPDLRTAVLTGDPENELEERAQIIAERCGVSQAEAMQRAHEGALGVKQMHPLCTLFPRMEGAEFDALVADVRANGLLTPIVVLDGQILDGANRYRACIEAGIEPEFVPFHGGDPVSFVLSANFHRRHLSAGQQAAVVAAAQDWAKAARRRGDISNQRAGASVQALHTAHSDTAADRAKVSGASLRTQRYADKVAKAAPELAKAVAHGKVSLPAAVEQVTGKRPGAKPAKPAVKPAAPGSEAEVAKLQARIAELETQAAELKEQLAELASNLEETLADNESMTRVFEADDRVTAALAEAKKSREIVRQLDERIRGLMNERNEAIRSAKYWRRQAGK